MLVKNPGFTLIAVLTLSLGIGANTALFSVVNGILLRPLPYAQPDGLLMIWGGFPTTGLLSYGFWQRRFAADPNAMGQLLTLNGQSFSIIGVLPPGFQSPQELRNDSRPELWVTLGLNPAQLNKGSHNLNTIARLKEGVTPAPAENEARAVLARVVQELPSFYPADGSYHNFVTRLHEEIVGQVRLALLVLLGAVGFVLLIACANVANLQLARGEARQKELAIRAALGASRFALVRQLLGESVLLALIGGGGGVLLAMWGLDALVALSPGNIPRLAGVRPSLWLDGRVFGFTLLVSLLTGIVFGLAPALRAAQGGLHERLKEGGRGASAGRNRLRSGLVVAEVALSLALLAGAGLLIRSFRHLQQVNPGFNPQQLLTLALSPPASAYQNNEQVAALYEQLFARIQALPGVEAVTASNPLPLTDGGNDTMMQIEGRPFDLNGANLNTNFSMVSPAWFQTLGVRLARGRFLSESDHEKALPVAVINETLARAHWPNEDPVGKRVRLLDAPPERATTKYLTIVGVVGDVKNQGVSAEPRQEMFVPLRQQDACCTGFQARSFALVIRTRVDPLSLAPSVSQAVWAQDRGIPISNVRTMEQSLARAIEQQRFNALLLGLFALVALGLGAAGIYGVISYSVSQRTRELGVALGLAVAFALTRLMTNLLFGVSATDPLTFAAIALLLVVAALLACWIPARRATKVDPMVALRCE